MLSKKQDTLYLLEPSIPALRSFRKILQSCKELQNSNKFCLHKTKFNTEKELSTKCA